MSQTSGTRFRHLLVVAAAVGVGVGLVATCFRVVWLACKHALWTALPAAHWRLPVSLAAGLLVGVILHVTFYPGALSALVRRFHETGRVDVVDNLPVLPVGLVGLVAGQNAGPEGVLSVVGGSVGTLAADRTGLSSKLLTLAGMGAGFGTILGAPIGGALLWLELPHDRGLEYYEAIVPTVVASFAGYLTEARLGGMDLFPRWRTSAPVPHGFDGVVWAAAVALACVPVGLAYARVFSALGSAVDRWEWPLVVRTTLAGGVIGCLGWLVPLSYFYGGSKMNVLLSGGLSATTLLLTLVAVGVAAAVTIHGNWIGGLVLPHMFMGAIVGRVAALLVPSLPPVVAVLAGAAAFNAVVTGTPLSSALIAIALTDGAAVTPVFLASLAAFAVSPSPAFLTETASRTESPGFLAPGDG